MNNSGPDLSEYLIERAKVLSKLKAHEKEAVSEVQQLTENLTNKFDAKRQYVNSEANEYERQYTGFFILAISFIVTGMLNTTPELSSGMDEKIAFCIAVVLSLVATGFLFFEWQFVKRLFNKWNKKNNDIITFINSGGWKTPNELINKINEMQETKNISRYSPVFVQYVEYILLGSAGISLCIWLYFKLF